MIKSLIVCSLVALVLLLCTVSAVPADPKKAHKVVVAHTQTKVLDNIVLTVAKEAGKAKGATVTNQLEAIFKFIAGNHPASTHAVNAIVQLSRDPKAKINTQLAQTIFGKYPEYKAVAKQLDNLVKSSSGSNIAVAAFIPIALALPEQKRLGDAERYVKEATKAKNAKPADVANLLYKQLLKLPLNFDTKANPKWVVDGSIAAMLVASGGDMIVGSKFNENLAKSHNFYLKDSNNGEIVIVV